jgi:ABC-2 type transport system permease protein
VSDRASGGHLRKFRVVARREFLERVRSKWFLVATLAGPVFFGSVIILPLILTGSARPSSDMSRIVVLDATGTDLGARIARTLRGGPQDDTLRAIVRVVSPAGLAAAENAATHEVMQHERIGYLALDSGTLDGEEVHYAGRNTAARSDLDFLTSVVRQNLLAQRLERAGIAPAQVTALTRLHTTISA